VPNQGEFLNELDDLPIAGGVYALHLYLDRSIRLRVGRSGEFTFPTGYYIYLGSARGPGGIRARLGRHLRGGMAQHWHIDMLREVTSVAAYYYEICEKKNHEPLDLECRWSQNLASLPGSWIPAPGFGASDCRSRCPAHLVGFKNLPETPLSDLLGLK